MAEEKNTNRAKPKVPLKVSAPHVSGGAAGAASDNEDNKNSARKGALFLVAVVGVYVLYLVFSGQMGQFLDALGSVDGSWVLKACLCFVMYYVFGVLAYGIAVYLDHDSPLGVRDLMSVEASGVFFGNLTPMMAGSVPSQIYRMTRSGLDVGEASATQFTRFIAFQFGVVLFAAIMLVAKAEYFFQTYGDLFFLNIVVFTVHFLELAGIFVICLCPRFVMRVGNWAIRIATRHNWLKDPKHWDDMVNVQVMEFAADFLECLAAGSMVQMVSSAVPLPGGTGGAEGGFLMFYGHMFGRSASAGFLIWRIVTFFGPTLLAAPLLGLRSNGGPSIYVRVQKAKARLHAKGSRSSRAKGAATISGSMLRQKAKGVPAAGTTGKAAASQGPVAVPGGIRVPMKKKPRQAPKADAASAQGEKDSPAK